MVLRHSVVLALGYAYSVVVSSTHLKPYPAGSLSIEYLEEMLTFSEMRERMSTAELEVAKVRLQHDKSSTIERPACV